MEFLFWSFCKLVSDKSETESKKSQPDNDSVLSSEFKMSKRLNKELDPVDSSIKDREVRLK